MRLWRKLIRNYFTFNNREKRGLYVLIILLAVLSSIHLIIRLQPAELAELTDEQKALVASFEQAQGLKNPVSIVSDTISTKEMVDSVDWKTFDPNVASLNDLVLLGLDSTIANRLVNYRAKGGRFKEIDDVRKIYGMDSSWVQEAIPHMVFPKVDVKKNDSRGWSNESFNDTVQYKKKRFIQKIELNSADSSALVELPWVGPF